MSAGLFLLLIIALVVGLLTMPLWVGQLTGEARDRRVERRQDRAEIAAVRAREKIATKALRAIANGAGNPIFEAQDALDNIESTYIKEIS